MVCGARSQQLRLTLSVRVDCLFAKRSPHQGPVLGGLLWGYNAWMALFRQYSFPAPGMRSLCWRGDELVDWVGGGRAFALDGQEQGAPAQYADHFDAATTSRDGRFAVIYERLGARGLLLKDGKVLREVNRSSYRAAAYEYPVALFHEPDGRLLLAHCPRSYCAVELEEVERGDRSPHRPNVSHAISSAHA